MRKLYSAVAVGAVALAVSACSSDATGPNLTRQYGSGWYQHSTDYAPETPEGNVSQCGWDAQRAADGQDVDKTACHAINPQSGGKK